MSSPFKHGMKEIKDKNNLIYLNNLLQEMDIYGLGGELIKIMHPEMYFKDFVSILNGFGLKLKIVDKDEKLEDPSTKDVWDVVTKSLNNPLPITRVVGKGKAKKSAKKKK